MVGAKIRELLLAVLVSISLVSCSAKEHKPVDCSTILESSFRDRIGKKIDLNSTVETIKRVYGLTTEEIGIDKYEEQQSWVVKWTSNGVRHNLSTHDDVLTWANVVFDSNQVTAGNIINCIGSDPDYYFAAYGPNYPATDLRYSLQLLYPSHGVRVSTYGSVASATKLPSLNPDIGVSQVVFVEPGSLEEVYPRVYHGLNLSDLPSVILPRPWPGDWKGIAFTEETKYPWW
jgi:hypothetical protein